MDKGFQNGAITFDQEPPVFYSGQVVSGKVTFDLDQTLMISVLYIQYNGQAQVLWTETEGEVVNGVERVKEVEYVGRENYVNYVENLIGGTGVSQLAPGHHAVPFRYQLPSIAPSTFDGSIGQINYSVSAVMVYADPQANRDELVKDFEVVAPFDMNVADPSIKEPIEIEFEEIYGCNCFCNSSPITIRVKLPVSGYCPGQAIPIAVEVENESNTEITKMIFQIVKKEFYRSQRPESEYIPAEEIICKAKKGAIMGKSTRKFTCDLFVPEFIAPHLESCTIIDVKYFFQITIKLSGCNDSLEDEAEIFIGLVPLRETTEEQYIHPLAHSLPKGPIPVRNGQPGPIQNANIAFNQYPLQSSYPNNPLPYTGNNTSYPQGNNAPYRQDNNAPYPQGNNAPYPQGNNAPYPQGNNAPYAQGNNAPYPRGNNAPYPQGNNAPYPQGNNAPYAQGNHAPYPQGNIAPYPQGNNAPYPQGNNAFYPQGNIAPYPQGNNPPYPTENKCEVPALAKPFHDYDVGFKLPVGTPFPQPAAPSTVAPPYPVGDSMPQISDNKSPYASKSMGPSAPPPS